jgi:hypothetical protein
VPLSKLYKFTAATVMTTVAAATVVTFAQADQPASSPVAASVPQIPGSEPAPILGTNDETLPSASPVPDDSHVTTAPPPSSSPTTVPTTSSRSSSRSPKPGPTHQPSKPAPAPAPTQHHPIRDLLHNLLG